LCKSDHVALFDCVDLLCAWETRLERMFYRLFRETRITSRREFFRPRDAIGRDMVPLYVAALRALTSADAAEVKRWYAARRKAAAMQLWMEQQHSLAGAAAVSGGANAVSTKAVPSPPAPILQADNAVKTFRDFPLAARKPVPSKAAAAAAGAEVGGAPLPPLPLPAREAQPAVQPMELEVIDLP
jgi:hypothetical protein